MESKFYKGQSLWAIDPCVMQNGKNANIPALTVGKNYINQSDTHISITDDHGEPHTFINDPFKFFSYNPPRIVLTELGGMKRHKITQAVLKYRNSDDTAENLTKCLNKIESILSEPEPPKFVPKDGEAVLVKIRESDSWQANVSNGRGMQVYGCFDVFKFIRPFDPALVGKVTND